METIQTRDRILEFVKIKGPVLPVQISKDIGSNILMASAHLAELTASNKLKISTIKVGGSPLYYLPGQEHMLQKYTSNMNDKEKKAFDLLNQNKILSDAEQEPVIRVALREIKDFAIPLNVNYNGKKEVFWKWYLLSNEEAEILIKSKLNLIEKKEEKQAEQKVQSKTEQAPVKDETNKIEQQQKKLKEDPAEKAQETLNEKPKEKPRKYDTQDLFFKDITRFFEKNKISVISSETIKKNSEIDFIVEIPSVVGNLQYYCKAKNKKKISDSDLSNAYVRGQLKRLPVLVLSYGELSPKAQGILSKELNNLTFKKI